MASKQIQEAGDNSQQLQANNMIVNIGIDEKRAREIYQEMNLQCKPLVKYISYTASFANFNKVV